MKKSTFILILALLFACKKDDVKPDPEPIPVPVQRLTKVSYSELDQKYDTTYTEYEYCKFYYDNAGKLTGFDVNWWKMPCADVFQRINVYYKNDTLIDYLELESMDTTIICEYWNGVDTIKYDEQITSQGYIQYAFYDSDNNFLYFSWKALNATYKFYDNGKLERIERNGILELFELFIYNDKDNLTNYSMYSGSTFGLSWTFTYGEKNNPFYQFNPYTIIRFFPLYESFVVYSPNNLLTYQLVGESPILLIYEFDENNYPIKYYRNRWHGGRYQEYTYHFEYETFYINQ